jgi:hypothetical protein
MQINDELNSYDNDHYSGGGWGPFAFSSWWPRPSGGEDADDVFRVGFIWAMMPTICIWAMMLGRFYLGYDTDEAFRVGFIWVMMLTMCSGRFIWDMMPTICFG